MSLQPIWLLVESDTHGGHRQGLLNPRLQLPENDDCEKWRPVELSRTQEFLWELRQRGIERTKALIKDDPLVYYHLGDPTQGDKYIDEWVTTRKADQVLIAVGNMDPIFTIPNLLACRFLMGTPSHELGEGSTAILIDKLLRTQYPKINIRTIRHGRMNLRGLTVNYAHHGPHPGIRDWTRGNVARLYLRDRMTRRIKAHQAPDKLYLRAHYHDYVDVSDMQVGGGVYYESNLIVVPSMCGIGAHGVQATKSAEQITNGLLLMQIVNGEVLKKHRLFMTQSLLVDESL